MIILVAYQYGLDEIEASSCAEAMDIVAEKIFISEYDKKYSNLKSVEKPIDKEATKELWRKLIVGAGEFYEYYEYHCPISRQLIKHVEKLLDE